MFFVLFTTFFLKVPPLFLRGGADRRRGFCIPEIMKYNEYKVLRFYK